MFIKTHNHLRKVAEEIKIGKSNIHTKIERKILSDIRDYKKRKYFDKVSDINFKDMKRT